MEVTLDQLQNRPELSIYLFYNGVDIPTVLIYIFNKYFNPYILLALILYVSLGI